MTSAPTTFLTLTGTDGFEIFSFADGDALSFVSGFNFAVDLITIDGVVVFPQTLPVGVTMSQSEDNTIIQYGGGDDFVVLEDVDLAAWIAAPLREIVYGTESVDIIDGSYSDINGLSVADTGQTLLGQGGNDIIYDGAGDDLVFGGSGNDVFFAGDGQDAYFGGSGRDTVNYTTSLVGLTIDMVDSSNSTGIATGDSYTDIKFVHGSDFADTIIGGEGVTNLNGEGGDDVITDAAGTQRMFGGAGSDVFRFIDGDNTQDRVMDFEVGVDKLDLSLWGVTSLTEPGLTLTEQVDSNGIPQGFLKLSYNGNEVRIDGLVQADVASFSDSDFVFATLDFTGATINGTSDADVIDAMFRDVDGERIWSGGQTILGEGGADVIYDGSGDDMVYGGAGNDLFIGGDGADQYFGGSGSNSVSYANATEGLRIDLTDTSNSSGIATGDSYTNIKSIYGSEFGDVIIADAATKRLYGGDGNDEIMDGAGVQRMYGGSGIDIFMFVEGDGARDRIMDFELRVDQINLSEWGIFSLDDPRLTIAEQVDSNGVGKGFVTLSYNGNEIRIDDLVEADIPDLISSDYIIS
ncbi:calcium-binding protein [Phaeobacter marinintestinus]|uniref:calcium-binding protein n=1 Tax=Falsiphaeobacter marinintestinus TaxID=1492905 RepID=UPI0011B49A72|nr:calcium-binding protein [Phaeobacter marinintestinus]